MRVARWKVMAGGLLVSAGGLMAVADGPVPIPGCQPVPLPYVPAVFRVTLEPPVAVPAPKVADLPPPTPNLPPVPTAAQSKRANPFPNPDPAGAVFKPTPDMSVTKRAFVHLRPDGAQVTTEPAIVPTPVDVAPLDTYPSSKPGVKVRDDLPPVVTVTPAPVAPVVPPPVVELTSPAPSLPPAQFHAGLPAADPMPIPALPLPAVRVEPTPPAPVVPMAVPEPAPADRPPPEPRRPEPVPPASALEKRLKVVLHMGDDRPRFEVRDGDEIYLKVVSDRVEVKSAADKADAATMKAGGRVTFVTPGGDGTCDELAILPGSGQVVAVGNVSFRHTWGRSETTVTAERMTFRLAHPGPTAIQAGYTPIK